jgi:anti-anti-sigma regulatory factor
MRKEAGLEITDRIVLTLPGELAEHREWIARETLAERVEPGDELQIAKT